MTRSKVQPPEFDYPLLVLVAALVGFGLVMVFSASYAFAYVNTGNPLYFFLRQLIWTGLGIAALVTMLNIDYRFWQRWAILIMALTLVMLLVVLLTPIKYGARRQFFNGSVQPSEIAKLAIIMYIATWLASKGKRLQHASYGLAPFAALLGLLVGLIVAQPDIDTSMLITATAIAMFFIAGADLLQLGILGLLGGLTFAAVINFSAYTRDRVQVFVASVADPFHAQSFHVREAISALVEGGVFGRGLADSVHKLPPGLPAVHSDSIFAVVGEELGLIGALLVVLLFLFFAYRGTRIALRATDQFGTLLAFGITIWLVLQAFINIAVITATFPLTGLPLPFFSYGGSSTVVNLAAVGILLNISRGGGGIDSARAHALTHFWRRNGRARLSPAGGSSRPARGARQAATTAQAPVTAALPNARLEFRYAGMAGGVEAALAAKAGLPFAPIAAGQLRIRHPLRLARNSLRLLRGAWQARRLVAAWRPDVVLVTGGYACAPVVWAAHRQRVPILIYLPDIEPGLAVRQLARYATRVAVTFPEVTAHFPGKAVVTGYPVRPELRQRVVSKTEARLRFDLDPTRPTLLIFGGSLGSRSINVAIAAMLPDLLDMAQIIHITGELDWPQAQARAAGLSARQRAGYRIFPYLHHEMATALSAANLVVARAGASILGEFPALGLPAILVPLPISGQHQLPNARYLADRGAAVIVADELMGHDLQAVVTDLLNHPDRLAEMSQASANLSQPDAASHLAQILLDLAMVYRRHQT